MPIRLAEPKDIPAITRAYTQVWRSSYQDLLPESFLNSIEPLGAEKLFGKASRRRDIPISFFWRKTPKGNLLVTWTVAGTG